MDCEKLIFLIQERKYLWDQREKKYHMRNVQKQLWKEVSTEMKLPEEGVRKKWRGLRDTFRKELMKQTKNKTDSGAVACKPPSWPFFSQLSFLIDIIKPRRMESSVLSVELDDTSMTSDESSANNDLDEELAKRDHACENVDSYQQIPTTSSAKKLFKSSPKKKSSLENKQSNFDEPQKDKHLEQKTTPTQDGDYQFLMSLLPYLHDIPKERKLFVRQKLMGVLIEESQQQDFATSTHSTLNYSSDDADYKINKPF